MRNKNKNSFRTFKTIFCTLIFGFFSTTLLASCIRIDKNYDYVITFETNGGSLIDPIIVQENIKVGGPQDPTKYNFYFSGWYLEPDLINSLYFPTYFNEDTTLYAKWEDQFTLTFETNGGTAIAPIIGKSGTYIQEEPITTKNNYRFFAWYTENTFLNSVSFPLVLENNLTLYAKWERFEDNVEYKLENGNYVVTGVNYLAENIVIKSYIDNIPVVKIKSYLCWMNSTIKSITIPETIVEIGEKAFSDMYNLVEINYSANLLTYANDLHFFDNSGSESTGIIVNIGANVTTIPNFLFYSHNSDKVTNIKQVNFLPNSQCTTIEKNAFAGCDKLEEINIPDSVTTISQYAFTNCKSLGEITIYGGIIGNNAFSGCLNLKTITLEENVKTIGRNAFNGCSSLEIINYNAIKVDDLDDSGAFTSNKSVGIVVNIGENVERIPAYLFYSFLSGGANSNIEKILFAENSHCTSIGKRAFSGANSLTTVELPNSLENIEEGVFVYCVELRRIVIPSSVVSIGKTNFSGCHATLKIFIDQPVVPTTWNSQWNTGNYTYYLQGQWTYDSNHNPIPL